MIEIIATVKDGAIHPCGPWNAELLAKAVSGREYKVRLTRARSLEQHGLYWSWLTKICDATGWHSAEGLHQAIKYALGHLDTFTDLKGTIRLGVGSTGFDAMDQDGFNAFFNAAQAVVDEKWDGLGSAILTDMGQLPGGKQEKAA